MVNKNENYTLEITGMTHEGQGVGRIDNFTVFVDRALPGEKADIKVIKVNKSYAVGRLIRVVKESGDRTEPFCGAYKRCGGCGLQHMNYAAQLRFKTDTVRENIKRIGGMEDIIVHEALGMSSPMNYRNKVQYPVGVTEKGLAVGFYAARSHEIIENDQCGIQNDISDSVREIVKDFIANNNISAYNETTGKGLVRHLMVRTGYRTGEVMVVLVINGRELPKKEEFVKMLLEGSAKFTSGGKEFSIKSVFLNVNMKNTNIILGDSNIKLYGQDHITDYIGKFKFKISPLSFFQVNPVQTEVLYSKALEYANLTGNETVFDLYCGIGTISLFLSEKAKKVYGVEVVEDAIADAKNNAALNEIHNAEFVAGEAEKIIPEMYKQGIRADMVVVDPPRKGCDEVLLNTLVDMQPQRIVYVSCNPSTLARDLKYLDAKGFKTVEVQPVDMFPWTAHVEAIVLIQRAYT